MRNLINQAAALPCGLCFGKVSVVVQFYPDRPELKALVGENTLMTGLCSSCFKKGLDFEAMELNAISDLRLIVRDA